MRLNDMTDEIKKHIGFASDCFKYENKILAICWGLQVCSVAAGGKVASGINGAHIGIASDIEINDEGQKNPIYKNKKLKFTSPAFNYDEVCEMPHGATLLSSDKVNKVMGLHFISGKSEIWGLQYHPDYEYWQMINLSSARKDRILKNNVFNNEDEFQNHLNFIKEELKDPFSANLNNSFSEFSIICCPLVLRSPNLASSIVCSEIFISSLRTNIS